MNTDIISLAARIHETASSFIEQELHRYGYEDLAPCHGDIFICLYAQDGRTISDLAVHAHRTKATVSVLVNRLLRLGYVEKQVDTKDARSVKVYLTAKGRALQPVFSKISEDLAARVLRGFEQYEILTLQALLHRCRENMEA